MESNVEGLKYDFSNFSTDSKKGGDKNAELLAEVKVLQTLLSQLARTKGKPSGKTEAKIELPAKSKSSEPIQRAFSNEDLTTNGVVERTCNFFFDLGRVLSLVN